MVGFRTYGGGVQSPKPKSDIQSPECAYGRAGGFAGLGRRPKFYYFFGGFIWDFVPNYGGGPKSQTF